MTTTLIIVRHGNTFEQGEPPRRVGARTDIPLVQSGKEQALRLGAHFRGNGIAPDVVYAGRLKRSTETAQYITQAIEIPITIEISDRFSEIDFGVDENKPEDEVVSRLGAAALAEWERVGTIPPGWKASKEAIISDWVAFSEDILAEHLNKTVMVVTSSGVARFALALLGTASLEEDQVGAALKMRTGAYGVLTYKQTAEGGDRWQLLKWNVRP